MLGLRNYGNFKGRASRAEYWAYAAVNFIVFAALDLIGSASSPIRIVSILWALALLIPGLSVAARRLHDTDKSGWLLLLYLIPVIGFLIILVFLVLAGNQQNNKYGSPRPLMREMAA